jgi:hypothetical protein
VLSVQLKFVLKLLLHAHKVQAQFILATTLATPLESYSFASGLLHVVFHSLIVLVIVLNSADTTY